MEAERPPSPAYPPELVTLGRNLRKRRLDLGLLQRQLTEELGVDATSITNWEKGRTSPSFHCACRIVKSLDYVPGIFPTGTLGERIVTARRILGLTQEELARRLGVDPGTLSRWERDERQPSPKHLEGVTAFLECLARIRSDNLVSSMGQ